MSLTNGLNGVLIAAEKINRKKHQNESYHRLHVIICLLAPRPFRKEYAD